MFDPFGADMPIDTVKQTFTENEKLIFKILKRGDKLNIDTAKEESDLVDGGLRYDLTVPLVRYYSNNANASTLVSYTFPTAKNGCCSSIWHPVRSSAEHNTKNISFNFFIMRILLWKAYHCSCQSKNVQNRALSGTKQCISSISLPACDSITRHITLIQQ